MSWDALQSAALDALGHVRYRVQMPGQTLPEHPLVDPLLHAAGLQRDADGAFALMRSLGPLDALRAPTAKRALWPRLRGLRAHGG